MWRGIEGLVGRFVIANNVFRSSHTFGKQQIFSRMKVLPQSIAIDAKISDNGHVDFLFNFDGQKYNGVRVSKSSKYPSISYTADISGQFLKVSKIPLDLLKKENSDQLYHLSLSSNERGNLSLFVNNKHVSDISESFLESSIGLEISEHSFIHPPKITLKSGQIIQPGFKRSFEIKYYFNNFILIIGSVMILSLLTYKYYYRSLLNWLKILLGLGITWYLFDYFDYSKRGFRWNIRDNSTILPNDSTAIFDYEKLRNHFFRKWFELVGGNYVSKLPPTDTLKFFDKVPWRNLYYCVDGNCIASDVPENQKDEQNKIRFMVLGGSLSEGLGIIKPEDAYPVRIHNELKNIYQGKLSIESMLITINAFKEIKGQLPPIETKIRQFKPDYLIINITGKASSQPEFTDFCKRLTQDGIIISNLELIVEEPDRGQKTVYHRLEKKNQREGHPNIHFHFLISYFNQEEILLSGNLWWDQYHLTSHGHELLFRAIFPDFLDIIKNDRKEKGLIY